MRYAAIGAIRLYQWFLSPLWAGSCKYHPSCSRYAVEAYARYGFFRGTVLSGWRLLRCNPWSYGGVDHVQDQRMFR